MAAICPGIYRLNEGRDGLLARLRLPGGWLSAEAARAVAGLAARFGNGRIDLTHRANLQIRGLAERDALPFSSALARRGLLPADPGADRRRNLAADPLRGLDPDAAGDSRRLLAALDGALLSAHGLDALSPKVSVLLDGGGRARIDDLAHDIGLLAAGSLWTLSLAGRRTGHAVPEAEATALVMAGLALLAESGVRMADLVAGGSPGAVVSAMSGRAGIRTRADPGAPARPAPWQMVGRFAQKDGLAALGLAVPVARLTPAMLTGLAALAEAHGDRLVRLTHRQSVVLTGIRPTALELVEEAAASLGLDPHPSPLRIFACAGASGCLRGAADAKADGRALGAALDGGRLSGSLHLSACARGCAHPAASDYLLLGRDDGLYDLHEKAAPSAPGTALARGLTRREAAAFLLARAHPAVQKAG